MSWQPPAPPAKPTTKIQSYYQILQVDPQAHPAIIRNAYRFLAALYHPDNSESGNTEKFKTITEAWRTLSDSAKRQVYDAQLGIAAQVEQASNTTSGGGYARSSKPSLSWSEVELRLAVLQILMEARRKRPQSGGASAKMLMDCLGCNMDDIEYVLWYLREKNYITRSESVFVITINGVDYLIDQLSKIQPMDSGHSANVPDVNLPANVD